MKAAWILLFGLGVGAVAVATFVWLPDQSRGVPRSPAPIAATSVASPLTASRMAPESKSSANLHATLHAKLRQWWNTATGETAAQEAITQELIGMLSDDNVAGIVQSLSPQELHTPFGSAALERWLDIAPAEAARWLATRPDATERQAWLVARRFQEAPAALQVYCDQLPANAWKEQVLQHASLDMADIHPSQAIAFAQRLAPGEAKTNAFETIAYAWFERDPTAALRWAQTIADTTLRERLFAVGAKAIARADPDLGLDWLAAGVKSDGLFRETALSIVEVTAQQTPE